MSPCKIVWIGQAPPDAERWEEILGRRGFTAASIAKVETGYRVEATAARQVDVRTAPVGTIVPGLGNAEARKALRAEGFSITDD